jgi:hypothetical protein
MSGAQIAATGSEHPMVERIAALSCCMSLLCGSVVSAQDTPGRGATISTTASSASQLGPLRKALLSKHVSAMLAGEARQQGTQASPDRGNWAERHPVWTGTLVGFAAGFTLTYAMAANDDPESFIRPIGPGAPALVIGGPIGAGLGALAGWGIARNRDEEATAPPMPE